MPTLLAYRQYVAKELGNFLVGTAAASSTTSTLVDSTSPIKSTLSQDDYWVDTYLLRPSAALASDKVRVISSYAPTTGTLTVDNLYTNAPTAGEVYELHGVLEPVVAMNDAINEALKRTLLRTEIVGTPIAQASRHSLTGLAPWLTDPAWVRQVGWLGATDDRNKVDPYWRVVKGECVDEDTTGVPGVAIQHPGYFWNGTEVLYLRVIKRGYDHCRVTAGTFGGQVGLALDTDEAPINLEWLGAAALVEVWRRFNQGLEETDRKRQLPNILDAAARFSYLTHQNFTSWPLTFIPRGFGGPRWRSAGISG